MLKKFLVTILLLAVFITCGCGTKSDQAEAAQDVNGDLKISIFEVEHGDAILIQTGKQSILIDTANPQRHADLVRGLEKFSVTKIDKLIITHPHSDHIGGATMLINPTQAELQAYPYLEKISIGEVYDNGVAYASKLYRNYLKTVAAKKIPRQSLNAGDILDFGNGVEFKVLWPTEEFVTTVNSGEVDRENKEYRLNNSSIVGKLTYKNFSMMLTGDCEKESEAKILASNDAAVLKCDVLKSGHHGLSSSSSKNFVETVKPSCVLISTGNGMKDGVLVGSPRMRVLKTYLAAGVDKNNIFCTRFNGTFTLTSDGNNFSVEPERKEDWVEKWIAHLTSLQKEQKK